MARIASFRTSLLGRDNEAWRLYKAPRRRRKRRRVPPPCGVSYKARIAFLALLPPTLLALLVVSRARRFDAAFFVVHEEEATVIVADHRPFRSSPFRSDDASFVAAANDRAGDGSRTDQARGGNLGPRRGRHLPRMVLYGGCLVGGVGDDARLGLGRDTGDGVRGSPAVVTACGDVKVDLVDPALAQRSLNRTRTVPSMISNHTAVHYHLETHPPIDRTDCAPSASWQTTFRPNCNKFHEIDVVGSLVVGVVPSNGVVDRHGSATADFSANDDGGVGGGGSDRARRGEESETLKLLGSGGWRLAWEYARRWNLLRSTTTRRKGDVVGHDEQDDEKVVLKTLRWKRQDFVDFTYRRHRTDAVATDVLSSSSRVVDAYGHCGQSVLTEAADSTLTDAIANLVKAERKGAKGGSRRGDKKTTKKEKGADTGLPLGWTVASSKERLRYGRDAALALADLRGNLDPSGLYRSDISIDPTATGPLGSVRAATSRGEEGRPRVKVVNYPTIVHRDVKPDNFVLIDGRLKLNDFNDAELIHYNATSGGPCMFRRWKWTPTYKSPEEAWEEPLTSAIDVHALGGVLYYVLTGRHPYEELTKGEGFVRLAVKDEFPSLPKELSYNTTDPAAATLLRLARKCRSYDPSDRPTPGDVAKELDAVLSELEERDGRG